MSLIVCKGLESYSRECPAFDLFEDNERFDCSRIVARKRACLNSRNGNLSFLGNDPEGYVISISIRLATKATYCTVANSLSIRASTQMPGTMIAAREPLFLSGLAINAELDKDAGVEAPALRLPEELAGFVIGMV